MKKGKIKGITTVSTSIHIKNALGEEKIIATHLIKSKLDLENTPYLFRRSEF